MAEFGQFYFEEEFEQKLLAFFVRDIKFYLRNKFVMKENYFVSKIRTDIYHYASEHMDKYNDVISQEALRNEISEMYLHKKKGDIAIDLYFEVITDLWTRDVSAGQQYADDKVLYFARGQNMAHVLEDGADMIMAGKDLNPILEGVTKALAIGTETQNIWESLPTFNDIDENVAEDWLVEDLLPRCAITVLYGKRGLGKSHLIYLIGKCVEGGADFFGHKVKQCPVYYIDYENPVSVQAHIKKICGGSNVIVWALNEKKGPPPRLDSKEWEIFKTFPPGLIIIDTFRASHGKNTQDDTDMADIMNRLKELWAKGFTIVILLHTLKLDDKMWKGNTVILDLSDHTLALFKVKSPGAVSEDEDEDEDALNKPKLLYFGVRADEKSRFRKYHTYIWYDPEKGFSSMDDPDLPLLNQIWESFNGWVFNERQNKGRGISGYTGSSGWQVGKSEHYELEASEYPNREKFQELITGWIQCSPTKAKNLIPRGLKLGFWNKDEVRIKSVSHHFYYPLILKK